ncbi:helix-turn-helix transcriptional regulator [uncultured Clostridium sp.]|uniref:helix-turn-helix transcriptional regulator n=1 Tax=uncultured Clostridium sp. TaxID=59620 RepID=UPI0026734F6D|nr:AraC family transcriptional regulator [uncultured Clostridium sp.]
MTALYTKLDNFFNCCNVPLSIIDLNSNFLYERNLNKLSKFTLLDLNIVDKIIKNDLNSPQEIISEHLKIVAIPFANNNKNSATFLLLGPYTIQLEEDNTFYYINCEKGLTYFIKLLKLFLSYKNTCSCEKISDVSPIIKESLDYVHKNYFKQITIDDICDKFKINKCYFCYMFKKETGQTFINYLNNYKIEKSKNLLENTNMTLLDISLEVGFNNQSYYSTIFKKYTNMTPLEYRETALYT